MRYGDSQAVAGRVPGPTLTGRGGEAPRARRATAREEHFMTERHNWQEFFDAHAPIYEENVFTKNTLAEVDFLLEELSLPTGGSVLDVGCGTGRHAVELARRGYAVTGLDLSAQMLCQAARAAQSAGARVEWVHADATRFSLPDRYDAAVCLCEGACGLLGLADDSLQQP
ncbi:MAG: methyltransferase domain-containing protein, partial [Candidatus Eisenbacteria bacterium]|nr:methyltransferase domain-containing protein [Candidatus Eisenbacteria bacterium]